MKEKSPAFQWYPKDCDTDERVRAMDDREFGFYVRCLNHSWLNGGLPNDPAEIMRVIGRPAAYVAKVWTRVGGCFQPNADGTRLVNRRQEEERQKQAEWSEKCRHAGINSGHARRTKRELPLNHSCDLVELNTNSSSASASSVTTPLPPSFSESEDFGHSDAKGGLPGFDDFRRGYDQTGKPLSEDDWMSAARIWISSDLERIAQEVTAELRHELINGWQDLVRNKQNNLIPNPATWLKREPWRKRLVAV